MASVKPPEYNPMYPMQIYIETNLFRRMIMTSVKPQEYNPMYPMQIYIETNLFRRMIVTSVKPQEYNPMYFMQIPFQEAEFRRNVFNVEPTLRKSAVSVDTDFISERKRHVEKIRGPESALYSAVCPIVYALRIFGLAPYRFSKDQLVPSRFNLIFAFVFMGIYSYIIYGILIQFLNVERGSPVLGHIETIKVVFNYCVAMWDIIITIRCSNNFTTVWNAYQDYDEKVRNLGFARSGNKPKYWAWSMLIISFILWTIINRAGMEAFDESWIFNVRYFITYVGTSASVIKFSGMTLLLGQRFYHLNKMALQSVPTATRIKGVPVVDLKVIERLHGDLMVAGESLDSQYSNSVLLWLTNLCIHIVSNLYFVIDWTTSRSWDDVQWRIVICLVSWLMAFVGQLVLLNMSCHFTSSEANSMGYILINWRTSMIQRDRNYSMETSLHLMNRRLNFSAGGCFFVNLPLLRSTIGLLTTYLVILLQLPD
ncbi:uncharacterized protein LOC105702979 [Orussus abietinus]|uniref:uncharacterized protein LOC105702979 n=1 Tax=Orussus abietinus TaxID=222816 RepID=UPI000625124A|nr:uncharacterized protein LOC105702979 [Orussus abietinus]